MLVEIDIPGEPVAQGRPRFSTVTTRSGQTFTSAYDPAKSRNWKAMARDYAEQAMLRMGRKPVSDLLEVEVRAYFTCPKSDHRKTAPRPLRRHGKKPDAENVAKAVLDAMEGVVYFNDSQVSDLLAFKRIAAQGDAPHVHVVVRYASEEVS
jgi:Holliday junction resolvase RusA-like endonuclease